MEIIGKNSFDILTSKTCMFYWFEVYIDGRRMIRE